MKIEVLCKNCRTVDSGHILIWLGDDQASSHTALTGSHKREVSRAVTNVCARELTGEAGSKAVRATMMLVAAETLQGQRGPRLLGEVVLSGAYSDQTRPEWEAAWTAWGTRHQDAWGHQPSGCTIFAGDSFSLLQPEVKMLF